VSGGQGKSLHDGGSPTGRERRREGHAGPLREGDVCSSQMRRNTLGGREGESGYRL